MGESFTINGERYFLRITTADKKLADRHAQVIRRTNRKVRVSRKNGNYRVLVGPVRGR